MTMQDEENLYFSLMGEEPPIEEELTLSEINESIGECRAMLQDALDRKDRDSVKLWRRMLQRAKKQRLEILTT